MEICRVCGTKSEQSNAQYECLERYVDIYLQLTTIQVRPIYLLLKLNKVRNSKQTVLKL